MNYAEAAVSLLRRLRANSTRSQKHAARHLAALIALCGMSSGEEKEILHALYLCSGYSQKREAFYRRLRGAGKLTTPRDNILFPRGIHNLAWDFSRALVSFLESAGLDPRLRLSRCIFLQSLRTTNSLFCFVSFKLFSPF